MIALRYMFLSTLQLYYSCLLLSGSRCEAHKYLLMSRTTLWVSHAAMLNVKHNWMGVVLCAVSKALVMASLDLLLATYVSHFISTQSGRAEDCDARTCAWST